MIRPKIETEDLLLWLTKICQMLIEQTHRKEEETLELKMVKPWKNFHFNPPLEIKEYWMIGLKGLEVYSSSFNINTTNNKFELYTDNFYKFSFEELKDELEEILKISDITPYYLQHETIAPRFIEACNKVRLEKRSPVGYIKLLMYYSRSPFWGFGSFFWITGDLNEDDIKLISN